jgi:hypothetical protein
MNGYVSWYLNGTLNKAEYPFLDKSTESSEKIVDYSGPINKLLPQDVLFSERASTVRAATEDKTRHDQVVGCSLNIEANVLGLTGMIFGLGDAQLIDIPFPCYTKSILGDIVTVHRLSDWSEKDLPPIRSDYESYAKYFEKYKEWRGNSCVSVTLPATIVGPIIGGKTFLLCVKDIFNSNYTSYLYNYIPLSSTEDVKGQIKIDAVSSATNTVTDGISVSGVTFSNQTPSTLFYSHMEESSQLGSLLQDTYAPSGADKVGDPTNITSGTSCKSVEVRSNAGDSLFASQLTGTLKYTANFTCEFNHKYCSTEVIKDCMLGYSCQPDENGGTCVKGAVSTTAQTCKKIVYITLSTTSSTPEVDNIWSRLVAGPMAVFKRIFPKTNTEGSVGKIMDIAGGTNITYSGTDIAEANTDLKLPHIGGVSEYFLKGIQTALRPKGFGETLVFEENDVQASGEAGSCESDSNVEQAMADASSKYGVPQKLLRAIFEIEGLDYIINPGGYVCSENFAKAAGVMQMTTSAYNLVACPDEKLEDTLVACPVEGKLSRCNIHDSFELAARLLLAKAGRWDYSACKATGTFPSDKETIYKASCNYYGSTNPDSLTINLSKSIPINSRRQNGDMNYCDIVCAKMGICPPYP